MTDSMLPAPRYSQRRRGAPRDAWCAPAPLTSHQPHKYIVIFIRIMGFIFWPARRSRVRARQSGRTLAEDKDMVDTTRTAPPSTGSSVGPLLEPLESGNISL